MAGVTRSGVGPFAWVGKHPAVSTGRIGEMCRKCVFLRDSARLLAQCDGMEWEVEFKPPAQQWRESLPTHLRDRLEARIEMLRVQGPGLGRPFVGSIRRSRHHNMKELRFENNRALFAFDPQRHAVVLVGGDKTNDWRGWYQRNIPVADRLYDQHLRGIGGGEQCRTPASRTKSSGRER